MIGRRFPILVALVALVVAMVVLDPVSPDEPVEQVTVTPAALAPLATDVGSESSTWFCPGGVAVTDGTAEHAIVVANPTEALASGRMLVFPEGGEPVSVPLELAPGGRVGLALASVVEAPWTAALVELNVGGVVASHEIRGVGGWDSTRCSSQASDQWYLPWGRTAPQGTTSLVLALFNPFEAEAVVDITFDTEDGFRSPDLLQGFLVPPRRLVTVDVGASVPVRQRVSTVVKARSGRLVVDGVQSITGTDGTVALDLTAAAPAPAPAWVFAAGRVDATTVERIAVYNPGERTADVEVTVQRPLRSTEAQIEPFQLQVPAGSYAEVSLNAESRIAQPLRHSTTVRSLNGIDVVAERVLLSGTVADAVLATEAETPPEQGAATTAASDPTATTVAPDPTATTVPPPGAAAALPPWPPGLAATIGSPLIASSWVLVDAARSDATGQLVIMNPNPDRPAQVTLRGFEDGRPVSLAPPDTLDPGRQVVVDLPLGEGATALTVVVEADVPVVVEGLRLYRLVPDLTVDAGFPRPDGVELASSLG